MDWNKIIEGLGTLSSGALVTLVVIAMLWFRSSEKKKNGDSGDSGDGDEKKDAACQSGECPNQDEIEKQGELLKDLHQVRMRDRTPFQARTDDAAADSAIHKGHAHSRIMSRETKHTRKLQAETARASGVSDEKISQIERDIDNDLTGEFKAIEDDQPTLNPDKS